MNKLSSLEIKALENNWMGGNCPCANGMIENIFLKPYFEKLREYDVIEIGPGGNPINLHYQCKNYTGVQPHECDVPEIGGERFILEDGLSYLRKQANSSAIIISFGVMDVDVLKYGDIFGKNQNNEKYMKELSEEIKRVSNPFAIVVAADATKYMGKAEINPTFDFFGGVYSFK